MSAARTQTPSPKKSEPALTFEWERLDRALGEGLEDMLAAHWEEVALDKDTVALAIDWDRYRRLERDEVLKSVAMRQGHNRRLVGYNVFFVSPPMHYRTWSWAVNDVLYLDPAFRNGLAGARLIIEAEKLIRTLEPKIQKIVYHSKLHVFGARGRTVGDLLTKLGYPLIEEVHGKVLF